MFVKGALSETFIHLDILLPTTSPFLASSKITNISRNKNYQLLFPSKVWKRVNYLEAIFRVPKILFVDTKIAIQNELNSMELCSVALSQLQSAESVLAQIGGDRSVNLLDFMQNIMLLKVLFVREHCLSVINQMFRCASHIFFLSAS